MFYFTLSLFIPQQLTVLLMCLSVLLNQSLAILANANTLLSLDGYPPSDCWKMKHRGFSHLPDLQAKKVFSVVNTFLADLVSAVLLVRILEQEAKKWHQEGALAYEKMSMKRDGSHVVHSSVCLCRGMVQLTNEFPSRLTAGSIYDFNQFDSN